MQLLQLHALFCRFIQISTLIFTYIQQVQPFSCQFLPIKDTGHKIFEIKFFLIQSLAWYLHSYRRTYCIHKLTRYLQINIFRKLFCLNMITRRTTFEIILYQTISGELLYIVVIVLFHIKNIFKKLFRLCEYYTRNMPHSL